MITQVDPLMLDAVTFKNVWLGTMNRMAVPKPLWGLLKDKKQWQADIKTIRSAGYVSTQCWIIERSDAVRPIIAQRKALLDQKCLSQHVPLRYHDA